MSARTALFTSRLHSNISPGMASLPVYSMASIFSTTGFAATVILNVTLVFLTVFHTRQIDNTYKFLIVVFASLCLVFSFIEMLVHPFYHSYNGGLINFNMVKWTGWSQEWVTILVASYSGVYVTIVSFFTVLFVFRYWTMLSSPILNFFKGWKLIILVLYAVFFGSLCGAIVLYYGVIDDYSRDYLREVMWQHYELDVNNVSGYVVIAYDQNGDLRWNSFMFSFGIIFLMAIQFSIVGYCGFQMHFKMNEMLKNVSETHRRLQYQFFKSLVLQITSPTLTFYIPAVAILTVPFLNLEWSLPTGLIVCSFSVYPPIDSAILMYVVSDYRKIIKAFLTNPTTIITMNTTASSGATETSRHVFMPRRLARLTRSSWF